MSRLAVNADICGFRTMVKTDRINKQRIGIEIESDCEMVRNLGKSLMELDLIKVYRDHENSMVFKSADKYHLHPVCSILIAIIKASKLESGPVLPHDVVI